MQSFSFPLANNAEYTRYDFILRIILTPRGIFWSLDIINSAKHYNSPSFYRPSASSSVKGSFFSFNYLNLVIPGLALHLGKVSAKVVKNLA
jgi:hypothetical protein